MIGQPLCLTKLNILTPPYGQQEQHELPRQAASFRQLGSPLYGFARMPRTPLGWRTSGNSSFFRARRSDVSLM